MERKWLEEKAAREALEAKVKSLKKKVKELKGDMEAANESIKRKEADEKHSEVTEKTKPQSRSNSIDEIAKAPEKTVADISETKASTATEQRRPSKPQGVTVAAEKVANASRSTSTESKGSEGAADDKPISQQTHSKAAEPPKAASATPGESIRRSWSGDILNDSQSAHPDKTESVMETSKAAHVRLVTMHPGAPGETLSPPRRRGGKDVPADKLATGKSPSTRSSFKSQTAPTIEGPASSGDSLGSASEFDPLRAGHVNGHGDGSMSTTSEPVAHGHQSTLSTGSSVLSFVTAPVPSQSLDFDPLSTSHQSGTLPAHEINMHSASTHMQPSPQHGYSQSMPNFVVNPNAMTMAFPVQQVVMNMPNSSLQQGWNQHQQQQLVGQNQYLPTQYAGANAALGLQPQQQHQTGAQAAVPQQQNASGADPFDELASRRAPGTGG